MAVDGKLYQTYLSHIQSLKHNVNLTQDKIFLKELEENTPLISDLDDRAKILYLQIVAYTKISNLNFTHDQTQRHYMTLYFVVASVNSEIILPYFVKPGKKFDWVGFKARLECTLPDSLIKELSTITL